MRNKPSGNKLARYFLQNFLFSLFPALRPEDMEGPQGGPQMETRGLFYRGCENQGTATDFAISEKSETRGEIFAY